jgi:HD-GYP domain-containing protein (c-di-GMP phosphodiesterase class II)
MPTKIPKNKADLFGNIFRDQVMKSGNIETALNKIGQVCTKKLKIEEVTFWQFTQNGENLACVASYKAGKKSPVKTKQVRIQQIKDYLKTLQNGLYMVVRDESHKTVKSASGFLRQEIKASLHVPIYIGNALSGVVQFNQLKTQRNWDLSACIFACKAAELAADTLQNFGMRGNEKYMPDIMERLNRTLDHVLKMLDLEYGMIRLDEIPVTRGYSPQVEMEFVNQFRRSPEFTHQTNIVTNIHQATGNSKDLVEVLKSAGVRSFVTVPITIDTYQAGCIHVAARTIMDWNQEAVSLLQWTAQHITRFVADIWVHQDNRTLSSLIQSFHNNAHVLNRMMLFDQAIKAVGESATNVLETDMAFIILRNPDSTTSCPWMHGLNPDTINRIIDTEGASVQSILRHSKAPILFPDVRKSILPISLQQHLIDKKARSTRIFPLVYEGQTMGAVVGIYKQVRLFTHNERDILSLFANLAALTLQNAWMYDQVKEGYLSLALALANAEDAREVTIADSSLRSAKLAEETARALNLSEEEVMSIHWAALLHDIGKKDIPENVLQKSGPLSEHEWKMIRLSPRTGEEMLEPIPQLHGVAKIIRHFREHYDGSGYPDHLQGSQIPVSAKVLAVTDAYTSMIDKRAYRNSRLPHEAMQEIQLFSGRYFDPVVVDAFNTIVEKHTG